MQCETPPQASSWHVPCGSPVTARVAQVPSMTLNLIIHTEFLADSSGREAQAAGKQSDGRFACHAARAGEPAAESQRDTDPKPKVATATRALPWVGLTLRGSTLKGLRRIRRCFGHNPVGVEFPGATRPKAGAPWRQPWAGGSNPFGIGRTRGGNLAPLSQPGVSRQRSFPKKKRQCQL